MLVCFERFIFCAAVAGSRKSSLSKRVSELEDACRIKEAERVDLELQLTQVQENLKKSLAGGVLGAPVEAKPPLKVTVVAKNGIIHPACSSFSRLIRISSRVGLQKEDTKYLQWDFTGELCHRAASKTPVCLCFCRNGHAEGQGALSTQTPCLVDPSLSVVFPQARSMSSSKRFSRFYKGHVLPWPHWAHGVQHFPFPHFLGHWFALRYRSTELIGCRTYQGLNECLKQFPMCWSLCNLKFSSWLNNNTTDHVQLKKKIQWGHWLYNTVIFNVTAVILNLMLIFFLLLNCA